jgi:ATP-dependent Clp protease ATP-binding subunit ClpC
MQTSQHLESVVKRATEFAQQFQHTRVSPLHLLLALLKTPECKGYKHLESQQVPLQKLVDYICHNRLNHEPLGPPSGNLNARSKSVLNQSTNIARQIGSPFTRTEHLLLGLLTDHDLGREVYPAVGISSEKLTRTILSQYGLQPDTARAPQLNDHDRDFTELCFSLNDLARQGQLDPVIGRRGEIERTMQILGRRRKNNPVLIGDAGVGKTAIAEGVAMSIVNRTCPESLLNREVFLCDVTALVSNAVYRGQMEGRLRTVLNHVRDHPHIILFIDEIHLIVGAGTSAGGLDVSNMMKAALSRGEVRIMGATTIDEYNKSISKDAALERRFQPVLVEEPTDDEALAILQGTLPTYETYHSVHYQPDAILSALQLSKRYIPNRRLPDKALDVLDEAGASVRMAAPTMPTVHNKTNDGTPMPLRSEPSQAGREQHQDHRTAQLQPTLVPRTVTESHVRAAISRICRIPLHLLTADDKRAALRVEEEMSQELIGQRHVLAALARYLRRSRTQLTDPNKPIGTLLLLGPTGVGKTLAAKRTAVRLTGSEKGLIALDMSEYMERHSVARLIGAPPGYRGYEDQTTLVEKVRRQPYSVVLFDEIEKAHALVWNVLLQILEEGRLTDGQGRVANFRQTLILLASNIGYAQIRRGSIGFQSSANATKEAVIEAARREFKPEFLNRLDEILVFNSLTRDDCRQILGLEVEKLRRRTHYAALDVHPSLQEKILREGFSEEFGARPLKRTLERLIADPISDALLRDEIRDTGAIDATYNERDGVVIRSAQSTPKDLVWVHSPDRARSHATM